MSSLVSSGARLAVAESPRRHLSTRQAATVERLTQAAVDELRSGDYDALTVRNVARRAGVAPATAYTYFTSKEHLVTEVFWRRLLELPDTKVDRRRSAEARVRALLADIALLVADEPELSAACTTAMLSHDPDVKLLRDRIGAEMHRRLAIVLGDAGDPAVLRALDIALTGALTQAGMGHLSYRDLPDRLAEIANLLLRGAKR